MSELERFDMLGVELPTEPPELTVVLDKNEHAWQRREGRWHSTFTSLFGDKVTQPWKTMIAEYGPLTVLYVGPPKKSETID